MKFDSDNKDIAWCPGCGNFPSLKIIKECLRELDFSEQETVLVSGIGQAAKTPQYINTNYFNGLHGRALPAAVGIKTANTSLKVIVVSGDGDIYAEGGNHFIHTMRRNPDFTLLVFNNMIYGLTKGQASPTSSYEFKGHNQPYPIDIYPFNSLAAALAQNASFVSRAYCKDTEKTKEIIKNAIVHKGFALVDILQPCVVYNKINTYKWFSENTYYLENDYVPNNRVKAFERAIETEKLPLGIFFKEEKTIFEESAKNYNKTRFPLYQKKVDCNKLSALINTFTS